MGKIYNIGGTNEKTNLDVASQLIKLSGHEGNDDGDAMLLPVRALLFESALYTLYTLYTKYNYEEK